MKRNKKSFKAFAVFTLINFLINLFAPTLSYALTSGPSQPEFSSFEPVATTQMVDLFSGDFVYNIPLLEVPGPHGSGYPVSLSYHSGVTPEAEASWVGLGWTLNAGAINRNTRGFPDDYNKKGVIYHNKMPVNKTVSANAYGQLELFSVDKMGNKNSGPEVTAISANFGLRYNNYRGFGRSFGLGLSIGNGVTNLGFHNENGGDASYSLSLNPAAILSWNDEADPTVKREKHPPFEDALQRKNKAGDRAINRMRSALMSGRNLFGSQYGIMSYNDVSRPTNSVGYTGKSTNVSYGVMGTFSPLQIGISANVAGKVTTQTNIETTSLDAYGYLYSHTADRSATNVIFDYHVEKQTPFNKRDKFLGIPVNTPDVFNVSGEGIGGGFRLHKNMVEDYYPNQVLSTTSIKNVGGEIELGTNIGGGLDIGVGWQKLEQGPWNKGYTSSPSLSNSKDMSMFFNNDPGTYKKLNNLNNDDIIIHADLNTQGIKYVGLYDAAPKMDPSLLAYDDTFIKKASSYIRYEINSAIANALSSTDVSKKYATSSVTSSINGYADRGNEKKSDLIGSLSVTNESGITYNYSLPVYGQNESSLQLGVGGISPNLIENEYLAYGINEDTKLGEERISPYASTYLLTDIQHTDFIDRELDGPTSDDFGGYTKFNYIKNDNSYKWRMPYKGLIYEKNALSNFRDDLGVVSEGEKEIYYLQSIETKSHIAIFKTAPREDGKEAPLNPMTNDALAGPGSLERLDRIELYALNDQFIRDPNGVVTEPAGAIPVKVIHFEYAGYGENLDIQSELTKNTPNSSNNRGKLTLKKVYFTYQKKTAKISPYDFSYSYPRNIYSGTAYGSSLEMPGTLVENPDYDPFNIDAWGYYQANGASQYRKHVKWLDQGLNPVGFDPAAWHLKGIKLPSGGEIHIQYEQDDYSYVQDETAHVMTKLVVDEVFNPKIEDAISIAENAFYIDINSIIPVEEMNATSVNTMVQMIRNHYENKEKRVYFKFLYNLNNDITPVEGDHFGDYCNAEYISGYARVLAVSKVEGKDFIKITLNGEDIPKNTCVDFVRANALANTGSSCIQMQDEIYGSDGKEEAMVRQLVDRIGELRSAFLNVDTKYCGTLVTDHSYFRLPTPNSKKGGGVRVKSLLRYDSRAAFERQPVVYGNEYIYKFYDEKTESIRSSGVATNEPMSIREENILVYYIPRDKQKTINRSIAGKDKKQTEGPVGESYYPGASVGYSRVAVKNIHTDDSQPGFTINEFYTAKEHPVKTEYSKIDQEADLQYSPLGLVNSIVNKAWATQGFNVQRNNMHGLSKQISSFSGNASDVNNLIFLNNASLTAYTSYEYFKPGEDIPTVNNEFSAFVYKPLGQETDVIVAHSRVNDEMNDINIEGDIDVGFWGMIPIPFVTAMPSFTHSEMELKTHATTKVHTYSAILKSTVSFQNGIKHTTENIAFDENTGKPVITKSYDEHTGAYYSKSIPAAWQYKEMGSKAANDGLEIVLSSTAEFNQHGFELTFSEGDACYLTDNFYPGDIIDPGSGIPFMFIDKIHPAVNKIKLIPSTLMGPFSAYPAFTTSVNKIKIIKSGRTNQLTAQAGEVTYHDPFNVDEFNFPVKDEANPWIDQSALAQALDGALSTGYAAGPIANVNISAFISCLAINCKVDPHNATITDVTFELFEKNNKKYMDLISFKIDCDGDAGNGNETEINCQN